MGLLILTSQAAAHDQGLSSSGQLCRPNMGWVVVRG